MYLQSEDKRNTAPSTWNKLMGWSRNTILFPMLSHNTIVVWFVLLLFETNAPCNIVHYHAWFPMLTTFLPFTFASSPLHTFHFYRSEYKWHAGLVITEMGFMSAWTCMHVRWMHCICTAGECMVNADVGQIWFLINWHIVKFSICDYWT